MECPSVGVRTMSTARDSDGGQQRGMSNGKGPKGLTSPTGLTGKRINGTTAPKDIAHYSV